MSEIAERIRAYRYQEEQLLSSLRGARHQTNPITAEATRGLVGELGAIVSEELLGLRSIGRRLGRAIVTQGEKQRSVGLELSIQAQHEVAIVSINEFLRKVSERTGRTHEPGSNKLMRGIVRAQGYVRLETRITKTIAELRDLEIKNLVYNNDFPNLGEGESSAILERFPRLSTVRSMLPEVEPRIRKFLRESLITVFGQHWENNLKSKFSKEFPRWSEKANAKGSRDPLDGQTFGELIQTLKSFSELSRILSSKPEFYLSLKILSSARPVFIHPLELRQNDIREDEFRKITLAIHTIIGTLEASR